MLPIAAGVGGGAWCGSTGSYARFCLRHLGVSYSTAPAEQLKRGSRRRANGSLRDRANGSLRDRFLQKACRARMRVDMFARDVCLYTRMREHVCACLCLSA